jgi:hypothetical protein
MIGVAQHWEVRMSAVPLDQEIVTSLATLAPEQKRQVLAFVRFLTATAPGVSGQSLLSFAATIPSDDLTRMKVAIEEACEQVNPNDW